MADQPPLEGSAAPSDVAPLREQHEPSPTPRHRAFVWSLLALAPILLVLSITANWVQADALDTEWVTEASKEIVGDARVQEALAVYGVEQLYANVDVQGGIEGRLPRSVKALAVPATAATRELALELERRALASARVQRVISGAIGLAHEQLLKLVTDRKGYLATTDGDVTLAYGRVIADLAVRLGVDSGTVSEIQSVSRELEGVEARLLELQGRVESARGEITRANGGALAPETRQRLQALQTSVAEVNAKVTGIRKGIATVQTRVPPQLEDRLDQLDGRLAGLEQRLGGASDRLLSALDDPRAVQAGGVETSLGRIEGRLDKLLGRQLVQNPGELMLLRSTQLEGIQTLMSALRGLGLLLPIVVILLYAGALYLARGWRVRAMLAAGGGILAAALVVLVARRALGGAIVDSLAGSAATEPATRFVWDTLSEGLRERALFMLVVGVAFVGGGLVGGPGRRASTVRRFLAPYLREHQGAIYSVLVLVFLLWLALTPGSLHAGQLVAAVALAVLAVLGIEALRRQAALEFPRSPQRS